MPDSFGGIINSIITMKTKLFFTISFLLSIAIQAQTVRSEYLFTNGSLANTGLNTNALTQTGSNLMTVTGIENMADGAIELNGDVLNASLNVNSSTADSSIAFWIKTTDNSAGEKSIINLNGAGNNNYGFKFSLENGNLNSWMRYWDFGLQSWQQETPITHTFNNIADGNWHFIVLRIDEQPSQPSGPAAIHRTNYQLFVDTINVLNANMTGVSTGGTVALPSVQMYMGDDYTLSSNKYTGQIDNFRSYTSLIPTTEIINLYNEFNNPNQLNNVFVDASATGNNDGSSWADAFTDLQDGVTAAAFSATKEVWVAQGTYTGTTTSSNSRNATISVGSNDIKIYGGFNGTETLLSERDHLANPTIVDGDLNGDDTNSLGYNSGTRDDNSYNLFNITSDNVLIDGFILQNGHANRDVSGTRTYRGAAVYVQSGINKFTLRNCTVKRCVTNRGGAINTRFEASGMNELTIENCTFHDNVSTYASAIQILSTDQQVGVQLNNNLFYNNISENISGVRNALGGSTVACFANGSAATINLNAVNNTITQNIDSGNASGTDHATFIIRSFQGGIMNATFHNNNFFENYVDTNGTLNARYIGRMNIADPINSINFTHNNINQANLNTYTSNFTSSANVDVDPLFVDVQNADFSLQSGSPLIDAGDDTQVPVSITVDLNGNNRIAGSAVDVGAFEASPDTTPPTVLTQDILVQLDATGNVSIQPSDVDDGSSDDSGVGLSFSLDVSAFDCTNIGANTVTLTVTDQAGNSSSDTSIVTVVDNTAPNVVAQDVTLALGSNGTVNVTAQDVDNGSTDNCAVDLILTQFSQDLFTCADLGTNTVQYLVRDSSFNVGQATVVITIVDQTAAVPDAASLPDITAQCEITSLTAPTATDNCAGTVTATNNLTLPLTASTTITWTYDDGNGNTNTQLQNVIIADTTAPVADIATLADITAQCEVTSLTAPLATDNCAGAITATNNVNLPLTTSTTITWTYSDGNGNTSSQIQNVIIADTNPPVPDVSTLPDLTAQCEITSLTAPTATDNCVGTITATNNLNLPLTVSTTITWTYDDGNGNTSTQTQEVVIADTVAPTLTTQNTTVNLNGNTSVSINEGDVVVSALDNCSGTVTINLSQTSFTSTGAYNVDVTATDVAGNSTVQTVVVTVEDTLSNDMVEQLQIAFYPNPVQNVLTLVVDEFSEARLYNMTGKLVKVIDSKKIDMSNLSAGMYILKVEDLHGNTVSKKIVKQ